MSYIDDLPKHARTPVPSLYEYRRHAARKVVEGVQENLPEFEVYSYSLESDDDWYVFARADLPEGPVVFSIPMKPFDGTLFTHIIDQITKVFEQRLDEYLWGEDRKCAE